MLFWVLFSQSLKTFVTYWFKKKMNKRTSCQPNDVCQIKTKMAADWIHWIGNRAPA